MFDSEAGSGGLAMVKLLIVSMCLLKPSTIVGCVQEKRSAKLPPYGLLLIAAIASQQSWAFFCNATEDM